jgi:hypothetical protein
MDSPLTLIGNEFSWERQYPTAFGGANQTVLVAKEE